MSYTKLTQKYQHQCAVVKAPPINARLTFAAEANVESGATIKVNEGSLISLNSSGKFILGAGTITNKTNIPMTMFSCNNESDNGVVRLGIQLVGGMINGYVCTGGFELSTTEFVPVSETVTYPINTALVAATGSDIGKVTPNTSTATAPYTIVGIVSRGPAAIQSDNLGLNVKRLNFWTTFIPVFA